MARLCNAQYDKNKWKVIQTDNTNYNTYNLYTKEVDIKTGEYSEKMYCFQNIIGFEQVAEKDFLVFHKLGEDEFEIYRCHLDNDVKKRTYNKIFNEFYFLDDDKILFTRYGRDGKERINDIYSIKENKNLEEAKWISKMVLDERVNKKIVLVDELSNKNELILSVNIDNLEPVSGCYSTLRDKYIEITNKEDYMNLKIEEEIYIDIINKYNKELENKNIEMAKQKIKTQ